MRFPKSLRFDATKSRNNRVKEARRFVPAVELLEERQMLANSFLQGTVFVDANANNQLDPHSEAYIPGATVELRSSNGALLLATTTTDANGIYRFDDVAPGDYQLRQIPTPGFYNSGVQLLSPFNPASAVP